MSVIGILACNTQANAGQKIFRSFCVVKLPLYKHKRRTAVTGQIICNFPFSDLHIRNNWLKEHFDHYSFTAAVCKIHQCIASVVKVKKAIINVTKIIRYIDDSRSAEYGHHCASFSNILCISDILFSSR